MGIKLKKHLNNNLKSALAMLMIFAFTSKSVYSQNFSYKEKEEEGGIETSIEHAKQKWFVLMSRKNVDYYKVKKEFDSYFDKHPFEESGEREYGLGWLKTKVFYLNHKNKVQPAPSYNYHKLKQIQTVSTTGYTDSLSGTWRMIGPVNSVWGGTSGDGNNGGYVYCLRMDPSNPNKLFCSFETGGLWVSNDNATSWHLTDANMPASHYHDIDVCATNTNVVFAISTSAVIKSTNGGMTWTSTNLNSNSYTGIAYDIAASPTNSNVALARWADKIYRTTDGGTTWTAVKTGLKLFSTWDSNLNSEVLDWDNNNPNIVYFTDRNDSQNFVDVYKSTNGGTSFALLQTLTLPSTATGNVTGWSKISTATTNTSVVYVFIGSGSSAYSHVATHLYKLDVLSGTVLLQRINMIDGLNTSYGSATSLHHGDIAMDIDDENKIVWGSYSQQNVQYSTDNGVSFLTSSSSVHSDLRTIFMKNGKVLLGTDGAGYVSMNSGSTFSQITNKISNHELWGFGSAFKTDLLAAGCNHGPLMLREYESAGGWYTLLGADQGNSDVNPLDNVTAYSQGYDTYHVTRTGIKTYVNSSQQIDPGGIYSYFNSMEFHPNLYHTLITHHAGDYPTSVSSAIRAIWKNSLIRSNDNGLTVNIIKTFTTQVFREKICITDTNRIYVVTGLTNNNLMKTMNGGSTWISITPPISVTGSTIRNISDISVSDVNPDEIWVTYSGVQNTCKVLHSIDGGVSYTNMTQTVLNTNPITKMVFQRGTNGGVYVANASGVYYRNNTMPNWVLLGTGLPNMDIRFMFINYYKGKLLIGTSRGAWDHNLYEASTTKAQISSNTNKVNCVNPIVEFKDYSVVSNGGVGATYQWSFPGGTPSMSSVENPTVSYLGAVSGNYNVSLTVTDQYGTNTQTLTNFISYSTGTMCCGPLPAAWTHTNIGTYTSSSTVCYTSTDGNFKISSFASGVSGSNDNIPFVYQALIGDGEIVGRVKDVTANWNDAGGLMLRSSLATNSSFVFINSLDTRGVFDLYRTTTGGSSGYYLVTTYSMPMWLKIKRLGNTITTYYSNNGTTWTLYHTYTLSLGTTVYVGLTANQNNCITNIDNVTVTPANTTDLSDIKKEGLVVYPNPFSSGVTINWQSDEDKPLEFVLTDALGKEILTSHKVINANNLWLNLGSFQLTSGIYFLKIKTKSTTVIKQINKMSE